MLHLYNTFIKLVLLLKNILRGPADPLQPHLSPPPPRVAANQICIHFPVCYPWVFFCYWIQISNRKQTVILLKLFTC